MNLRIEVIESVENFLKLKETWNALNKSSENPLIFNTFEWQFNSYKFFKKKLNLFILVLYKQEDIIAIAPFVISSFFSIKKIEFIGSKISDILDFIIIKDESEIAINYFKNYLLKNENLWDLLDLYPISEYSPTLKFLNKESDIFFYKDLFDISPYTELPSLYNEYKMSLSKKFRFNLGYNLRNLQKLYTTEFKKVDKESDVENIMHNFFNLHVKRWKTKKLPGVLISSTRKKFHLKTANDLFKKNELALYYLSVDKKIISVLYGFIFQDKFYFYLSGFDPEFSKYSVGSLLINFCIEQSIENKLKEFDFLKGKEDYKYHWRAKDKKLYRICIGKLTSKSTMLYNKICFEKKIMNGLKKFIIEKIK